MSPRPQIDHIRRPQILSAAAEVIAELVLVVELPPLERAEVAEGAAAP